MIECMNKYILLKGGALVEIGFIKSNVHRDLVQYILDNARKDEDISGLMITGSLARGDALEGSDVDIYS